MPATDPSYKLIPLTQGQFAKVSAHRYEELSKWKWYAIWFPLASQFYAARKSRTPEGKRYVMYMHRFILGLEYADPREGDHRNPKDTLNNTDENLRIATRGGQCRNQTKRKHNRSGFKGIYRKGHRWGAKIVLNRVPHYLGSFASQEEAHAAYCVASKRLHGEFGNSN